MKPINMAYHDMILIWRKHKHVRTFEMLHPQGSLPPTIAMLPQCLSAIQSTPAQRFQSPNKSKQVQTISQSQHTAVVQMNHQVCKIMVFYNVLYYLHCKEDKQANTMFIMSHRHLWIG